MTWFFDQWVYGINIPHYIFDYDVQASGDGKYTVTCHVNQEKVPNNYRMFVLITSQSEYYNLVYHKIWIVGNYADIELPLLPFEPKKIVFNTFDAVLCKVDYK